jgi:Txe/YoeB family toxin of Txe-Axe toxin-antitoxin module
MKKIKSWTTKKIKEVLENPYSCSIIGTDFEVIKEELQDEYYRRLNKLDEEKARKTIMEIA